MYQYLITAPGKQVLFYKNRKPARIQSIDLLRGIVMIIMALDHTRDYFHREAFLYSPEDLEHTSGVIFFTRFITHYCAPIFVVLAGISAYLYGEKKGKEALSFFLFTRGLWLITAELFIVTLGWTFNPSYPFFNLQVIWATGISMLVLAGVIYLNQWIILCVSVLVLAGHNLLDTVHVPGKNMASFAWSLLHEPGYFTFGRLSFSVRYPLIPWTAIMSLGYCTGNLYARGYAAKKRQNVLLYTGIGALALFVLLRAGNFYGDAAHWHSQTNALFNLLSFLNVTKYPPSLLYVLITLGPGFIFLSLAERPLRRFTTIITSIGRVPMFYYLVHIYLIHLLAMIYAAMSGYHWWDMVLHSRVNQSPRLKHGYGVNLLTVYAIWIGLVAILVPLCRWFDNYKQQHQAAKWWLRYL